MGDGTFKSCSSGNAGLILFLFFKGFILFVCIVRVSLCVWLMCAMLPQCTSVGQKTTCGSWLLLPTMWVPQLKL